MRTQLSLANVDLVYKTSSYICKKLQSDITVIFGALKLEDFLVDFHKPLI